MNPINSILIANRGEIASRIIRTCRKLGIKSIAVFSEADRNAAYVQHADMAVFIGESTPTGSYLNQEKIIEVAKKMEADAIHPGYGFLAENAGFANRCKIENINFIGPTAEAIDLMGSKSKAKLLMQKNGVPVIPGYQGEDQSEQRLREEAIKIGFPILLKATAGGGGKGMRIVQNDKELADAIKSAKRESNNAFGDDELIIEKYIANGRHIEFQIFGDQLGQVVHLLERECTIQRRFQKIIEESPSPIMDEELRDEMGAAAIKAAKAINYQNAGSVEFIYDETTRGFYFLEINTRLQVEHPVTEEITGLDLVQMQIESAQGIPLDLLQEDVKGNGYAIEVRLYAEDPANNFLPMTGNVELFKVPEINGLRVETAVQSGSAISIYYDPMVAKLIVWDQTRQAAHRKMQYVLRHLVCLGTATNQDFLLKILENQDFKIGKYNTHFIEEFIGSFNEAPNFEATGFSAIAATLFIWQERENNRKLLRSIPSGWRNNFYEHQKILYLINNRELLVRYRFKNNQFEFRINDINCSVFLSDIIKNEIRVEINGTVYRFTIVQKEKNIYCHNEKYGNVHLMLKDRFPKKEIEKSGGNYESPMPSSVVKVLVNKGQLIAKGDGLVILSSMKMENTIYANEDGEIEEILVEEGMNVEAGQLLLKIK